MLARVGDVLLPPAPESGATLVVVPELLALADVDVAAAITSWLPEIRLIEHWPLDALPDWQEAFRVVQAGEAWQQHGDWLGDRLDTLGDDVRARFEAASRITDDEVDRARAVAVDAGTLIRELVGDRVLVLPATPSVAPRLVDGIEEVRATTIRLTCLAGLAGLPAVTVPLRTSAGLPCGVCLVGAPGRDRDLIRLADELVQTMEVAP